MWTRKFQNWITTTVRFMNSSMIPLQLILLAQIFIYLPSQFMIYPSPHKRGWYTPYLLPAAISVASESYVSTLTTPSDFPYLLPTDAPTTLHITKKDVHLKVRVNREYCWRKHGQIICYKKTRLYFSTCSDQDKRFYYCREFSSISSETRTCFLEHQNSMSQLFG